MKTIPLLTVNVKRDAMTLIPATVPQHEVAVLRAIHGDTNVYDTDEAPGSIELDPAAEGERLAAKYGEQAMVKAYGPGYAAAIGQVVSSADTAKPKKAAAPA